MRIQVLVGNADSYINVELVGYPRVGAATWFKYEPLCRKVWIPIPRKSSMMILFKGAENALLFYLEFS